MTPGRTTTACHLFTRTARERPWNALERSTKRERLAECSRFANLRSGLAILANNWRNQMKARRGITVLVASVVAVIVTLVATAVPASATDFANIPTNTPMRLINYNSFKCVQPVAGNGVAAWDFGAPIQQLPCGDNMPNYWTAEYKGEATAGECDWLSLILGLCTTYPVYQFRSNFSGMCLDVPNNSTDPWTPLQQSSCTGDDVSTLWVVYQGDYNGTYLIDNLHSFLCLDVYGASLDTGARLQQWTCTDHNVAQNFFYTP
jgi:hypothetical protein